VPVDASYRGYAEQEPDVGTTVTFGMEVAAVRRVKRARKELRRDRIVIGGVGELCRGGMGGMGGDEIEVRNRVVGMNNYF